MATTQAQKKALERAAPEMRHILNRMADAVTVDYSEPLRAKLLLECAEQWRAVRAEIGEG